MVMQFLLRQIQHVESVLLLAPRHDSGLIARTMIGGSYQLLWAAQAPRDRGRRWRSFSIIHDWRLMQRRLQEGIPVDPRDIRRNEVALKEFGHLHRLKKPKGNSADPYHKTWRGSVTLSDMADAVGRELYEITYDELSDWEHWGVGGIGGSFTRQDDQIISEPTSERVTGLALLTAFQCLFQTLDVAATHLSLNIAEKLQGISKEFMETMDSFYRK